jgi:Zn-dependent M16 (insulinase) family peptidase
MAYAAAGIIHNAPESISRATGTLVEALYLKRVKQILKTEPEIIIKQLEEIRDHLCQISNFRVLVIANLEKLEKPISAWETLVASHDTSKPLAPLDKRLDRLSKAGKKPGDLAYIIPLPTIDSSFAIFVGKGPESHQDPRVPAIMVAISYLVAVEGPLWSEVRGTGLAYGTSFQRSLTSGQITYSIYRSPDAFKAFAASKKVIEKFISGESSIDSSALEGAISSLILGFADSQANMAEAAQESFVRQVMNGLPTDWNNLILKRVRNVTVEEIKSAMKDFLLPIFVPETVNLFATCAPIMEEVSISSA